jgi:hypothetical protein
MVEAVRTLVDADARLPTRRSLDERLFVRWPAAYAPLSRTIMRLSPRSDVRRGLVSRGVLRGWGAWARLDLPVLLIRYARDCRLEPPSDLLAAGMRSSYEGHEGVRELAADWRDAWERMDVLPEEIFDAGDPIVVLGRSRVRARMTAIEFESPMASVFWSDRGLIVRQCDFTDWDAALSAASISAAPARRDPIRVTKP